MALLAAALTIGTASGCTPGSLFEWEIVYEDGAIESYATTEWKLDFEPRLHRRWQARTRIDSGPWSPLGTQVPTAAYPGDTDHDCTVGGLDYSNVTTHWGESCP